MKRILLSVCLLILLFAFVTEELDSLAINKIQVIGSNNSYKKAVDPALFRFIKQKDSVVARAIDYSHLSLGDQLSMGLQSLDIDIYADASGGRYSSPKGLGWVNNLSPYDLDGSMNEPGFKVLHIQDIDFRSNCLTFKKCLQTLKFWSDNHKAHNPVFITINAKDDASRADLTVPEKFNAELFRQLDATILEILGKEKLIIPDDIRGKHETLEGAVLTGNWPTLAKSKGKFFFILDEKGEKLDAYMDGNTSLKKRILFVNAEPGTPAAAFITVSDPLKDFPKIRELVSKGYIVRTRADADTEEARRNDKGRFQAACESGAQIITTDYYNRSTHFKSEYTVNFEGGAYIRKNPALFQVSAEK